MGFVGKRFLLNLQEGGNTFLGGCHFGEASASCIIDAGKVKRLHRLRGLLSTVFHRALIIKQLLTGTRCLQPFLVPDNGNLS